MIVFEMFEVSVIFYDFLQNIIVILYKFTKGADIIKPIFKALISATLCIPFFFSNFTVGAEDIKKITLLGDSITRGYGLSEEELNYGDYLKSYFSAEVNNFAKDGLTTEEQLEELETQEIQNSIQDSDIVCISIGGNDLLSIFEDALYDLDMSGGIISDSEGEGLFFNISSEFVQSFVINYTSAFGSAAITASENMEKIKNKIEEINPDAEIVMQTVYIPFESSDEKKNTIYKPLKTFASLYIGTINTAIKENAPKLADINLKFSEKPYLYTNIDNFDIHPNYFGHMLIAEEIIQTLGLSGDHSIFKDSFDKIPHGLYSQLPEYMSAELDEFTIGNLRNEALIQAVEKSENIENSSEASDVESGTQEADEETKTKKNEEKEKKEENKSGKNILSKIFLILGFLLIIFTVLRKLIKNKKGRKK